MGVVHQDIDTLTARDDSLEGDDIESHALVAVWVARAIQRWPRSWRAKEKYAPPSLLLGARRWAGEYCETMFMDYGRDSGTRPGWQCLHLTRQLSRIQLERSR